MYRSYIKPKDNTPLSLFEYSVNIVKDLDMMQDRNSHKAWALIIFAYEKNSDMREELMSIVKHHYESYFDEGLNYMFLEDKIIKNSLSVWVGRRN